ncbi:serine/threonine protein kinase [Pirellula staleyi DSM 6068]|uniref:Serine/threonine protein kinase n=1 Tax=Pirellula staleyi (strain ATCC 27377 / DSM 6068 / ICPB 4128) TaxID=530564 RepID=D2QZQ0_PIRSD|nr:serine/threonine-protein kinase [Pirellula staleyi]ADB16533.1 serine/threonine protein kinase [Pirellula staleyi DSM 6068]
MSDVTAEKLGQRILDSALLESRQIETVWAELGTREVTLEQFTSLLLRRELLTNYQLDRLLKGERGGYFYGEYRVLYLVGTGTFARVYRAVHKQTGRVVAVKVLRKRFRESAESTEQFLREGQVGVQLRHPSIVPIYEVNSIPSPYLVMEFVEGRNLREFTRVRKKLEPLEALRLTIDIVAGLAYAFEKGMTHRDIKMSNILVTSRGKAKIVDFGLAGLSAAATASGKDDELTNPRTIDYAGLERASGVRNNDPRSDLYFTGTILYNMLTGQPPLAETRDRIQRLSLTRFQSIKPVLMLEPNLPRRLASFVQRSIELSPERRFSSAQEMLEEAKRVLLHLEAGDTGDADAVAASDAAAAAEAARLAAKVDKKVASETEGASKTLMIIESKIEMQDALRERLKKHGYRVLIFSDPMRAIQRFNDDPVKPADCVIFSTPELGNSALEAFNIFGMNASSKDVPAILFVDQRQTSIIKSANMAPHRLLLTMPLKVRELRETLLKLLRPGATIEN